MRPLHHLVIVTLVLLATSTESKRHKGRPVPSCQLGDSTCDCPCECRRSSNSVVVNCSRKKLISIPEDLPADATDVDLSQNKIKTVGKDSFRHMVHLKSLKLNGNLISTIEDGAFNGLGGLENLYLHANNLSVLTPGMFFPLNLLKNLKLQRNPNLSIAKDTFSRLKSLIYLDLSYSGQRDTSFIASLKEAVHLKTLNLGGNVFPNLSRASFSGLTSKGLKLFLINTSTIDIENGTFSNVDVILLDLSSNPIQSSFPGAFFGIKAVEEIRMQDCGIDDPGLLRELLENLRPNTSAWATLKQLVLKKNGLKTIPDRTFIALGNLASLDLSENPFTERISKTGLQGLQSLKYLAIKASSGLISFPKFALENGTESFTPNIKTLDLSRSPVVTLRNRDIFKGLESLTFLHLDHTFVRGIILDTLPNLVELHMSDSCLDEMPAINTTKLTVLRIAENRFNITSKLYANWYIPNLEALNIYGNKFYNMGEKDTINFFRGFKKLKFLKMGKMALYFLPKAIFDGTPNLEFLQLSYNPLGYIHSRWFKNLKNLTKLNLADCRINTINEKNLPLHFLKQLKRIDLRHNSFACDCELKWFHDTIKGGLVRKLIGKKDDYMCNSPPHLKGKPLKDFDIPERCTKAYTLLVSLSASGVSIFVAFFIGLVFMNYYRWHVKYKFFKLKLWYYGSQYENIKDSKYKFDIHVHYIDEDFPWVRHTLMPELEDKRNYKLYIKDRDSKLCEYILENILYSIENSYKTVLCISNNFTKNPWSNFFLTYLTQKLVFERRNVVVCILLEEIEGDNLLEALELMLTERNYIKLPPPADRTQSAMDYFWCRVDEALKVPVIPLKNARQLVTTLPEEQTALLQNVC